jgi:hypothetical protein
MSWSLVPAASTISSVQGSVLVVIAIHPPSAL